MKGPIPQHKRLAMGQKGQGQGGNASYSKGKSMDYPKGKMKGGYGNYRGKSKS